MLTTKLIHAWNQLHFLRPWMGLALIPLFLIWIYLFLGKQRKQSWEKFCEPKLLKYILVNQRSLSNTKISASLLLLTWIIAVVALSGPSWEKTKVTSFDDQTAWVLALNLSTTMQANDLPPSRLKRAVYKLADFVKLADSSNYGLVIFSDAAFTLVPLTNDIDTINNLLPTLDQQIMPQDGHNLSAGLAKAAELIGQIPHKSAAILLLTDGQAQQADLDLAQKLFSKENIRIAVLAVGENQPLPIVTQAGLVRSSTGEPLMATLDPGSLQQLANLGGGYFSKITADQHDILEILQHINLAHNYAESDKSQVDYWQDSGFWLSLLLIGIIIFGIMRGYPALFLLILLYPNLGHAWSWGELWQNSDQRAYKFLQQGQSEKAENLFKDPHWKAVAQYQSQHYAAAENSFAQFKTDDDYYNLGNSLAHQGKLAEAIQAYDQALKLNLHNQDAADNKKIVEEILKKMQQKKSAQAKNDEQDKQQNNPDQGKDQTKNDDNMGKEKKSSNNQELDDKNSQDNQSSKGKDKKNQDKKPAKQKDQQADEKNKADESRDNSRPKYEELTPQQPAPDPKSGANKPINQQLIRNENNKPTALSKVPDDPYLFLRNKLRYEYEQQHERN